MLMDKILSIAQVVTPILAAVVLGMIARRKQLMTAQEVRGLQQFVMKFGLPCVIFNSCLTADIGAESLTSMVLVIPSVLIGTLWAFRARKRNLPYHNLPQLFTAQETGMLGIPLFMILFGTGEAYRVGILDMTQALVCYPTLAILTARTGDTPSPAQILRNVATSPFLLCSLGGLFLNLTGIGTFLDNIGIGRVITASTSFLAQPVSAMMIFSVGYNFSLDTRNRGIILRIAALRIAFFGLFGLAVQGLLLLIPGVDPLTRWSLLLFSLLPASYLAPGLGRSQKDLTMASGVCSVTTLFTLLAFCSMAFFLA